MLFSLAYCLIVASFFSWSSRTKSLLSKVSIAPLFKSFLILHPDFFVRIKQVVVKLYLKYATGHRIEVLYSIFHDPYIYKIMEFEFAAKAWIKWKKLLAVSLKASKCLSLAQYRVYSTSVYPVC